MADKPTEAIPIHGLFHTPANADEVITWCEKLPPDCRIAAITAATMMWNTLATQINKAFDLKESEDAPAESSNPAGAK